MIDRRGFLGLAASAFAALKLRPIRSAAPIETKPAAEGTLYWPPSPTPPEDGWMLSMTHPFIWIKLVGGVCVDHVTAQELAFGCRPELEFLIKKRE